jgi:hypothetical protein
LITVAFPTPLQLRPTAGHKVCLLADTNGLAQFSGAATSAKRYGLVG